MPLAVALPTFPLPMLVLMMSLVQPSLISSPWRLPHVQPSFATNIRCLPAASHQRVALSPRLSGETSRRFGRCEPWAPEKATLLEVINVIGRFEDSAAWSTRETYAVVDDKASSTPEQAATESRGEFAKKFDQVERVAFIENVPRLPFTDDVLARSVGKMPEYFAAAEVERAHLMVVFDALAQSKSTLVSKSDADERIASWRAADGSFDASAFEYGLRKGLVAVVAANAVLYGLIAGGVAIVGKVVVDALTPS